MEWLQNRTARWAGGAALISLLLVTAAWFVLISPRRAEAADLSAQNVAAQEANDALRLRLRELQWQFLKLADTRASLAEIRSQLPADAAIPAFVRAVDGIATSSGVKLVSITPSEAVAVVATPGAKPTGAGNDLVAVPVAVVVSGDYFEAVAFLRQLQSSVPRALLVTQLTLTTADEQGSTTVNVAIGGKIFVLAAGATAAGTSAGTSAGTGSSSNASSTAAAGSVTSGAAPTTAPTATTAAPTTTASPTGTGGTDTVALGEPGRSDRTGSSPW